MMQELEIALTHLGHRPRQSLVSVAGVALGVGFSIAMAAMMEGFHRDFIDTVIDATPHVVVKDEFREPPVQPVDLAFRHGAVVLHGLKPKDETRGIRGADEILREIEKIDGVDVAPTLQGQVFLRYGSKDVSATIYGIDPERERRVTQIEADMIAGDLTRLHTSANGIILGSGIAEKLGANLNTTLSAVSPAGTIINMKVVGLFRTGIIALDDVVGYTLLKKSQILQDRSNKINQIRIRVDDVSRAHALAAEIESRVGYRTESWEEANEGILGIFVVQNAIMYSTVGAILVVACFGIFNVVSTVVFEKSRDIAILKSLGFREGDIQIIFLWEGGIVGIVGMLTGWGLGYGLTRLLGAIDFKVEGIVETQGFILYYSIFHYLIAGAAAVIAATLAAYIPARRAATVNPVDIIRGAA